MSHSTTEKLADDQPSGDESLRNKLEAPETAPTYDGDNSGNADDEDGAKKEKEAKGSLRDYIVSST
jgi:hypothetical protein